jgi:hypothetical protein
MVEECTQGIDIGMRANVFEGCGGLFRRSVGCGSGEKCGGTRLTEAGTVFWSNSSISPSQEEHFAEVAHRNRVGIQVAVDEAFGVCKSDAVADLQKYFDEFGKGRVGFPFMCWVEEISERSALDKASGVEQTGMRVAAQFVDRGYGGMGEMARGPSFAEEAEGVGRNGLSGWKEDFEGDRTLDSKISGLVNRRSPTLYHATVDLVMGKDRGRRYKACERLWRKAAILKADSDFAYAKLTSGGEGCSAGVRLVVEVENRLGHGRRHFPRVPRNFDERVV